MSSARSMAHAAHSSSSGGRGCSRDQWATSSGNRRLIRSSPLQRRLSKQVDVVARGVEGADRLPVALEPMADQVRVQNTGPADAALHESKLERGESPRDAAEEERLAHRVGALREVADMVGHVVRDGAPASPSHTSLMDRRRHLELDALAPDRIVVVITIQAERVEAVRQSVREQLRVGSVHRADGPSHVAVDHHRLEAEHPHRVLELLDGLLGRVHRNGRGGRDPVCIVPVEVRRIGVERPAGHLP